jgi:hypothetical protein
MDDVPRIEQQGRLADFMRRGRPRAERERQMAFAQHVQESAFLHVEPADPAERPGMEQVGANAEAFQQAGEAVRSGFDRVGHLDG